MVADGIGLAGGRTVVLLLMMAAALSQAGLRRQWTMDELITLDFPYQTSRDVGMDICKARGFMNDIALMDRDVYNIHQVNRTIQRLLHRRLLNKQHGNITSPRRISLADEVRISLNIKHRSRRRRAATGRPERIWPYGVIPYEIQANFTGKQQIEFRKAMRHWENYTCISFVPRKPEHENYIVFTIAECGCCSFVGRRGDGPQAISIGKNCDKFGIVVHELGHVVGFWHEHTRPDRDRHVDIFYENIQPGQDYNFEKLKNDDVNTLSEDYDYASIMHYASDTFAIAMGQNTIQAKPDPVTKSRPEIGQRVRLSPGDIRQANKLYRCAPCGRTHLEPTGLLEIEAPDLNQVTPKKSQYCEWRVIAADGETISLNVTSLALPEVTDCANEQHNYLEIRDGHFVGSPLIGRLCGQQTGLFNTTSSRLFLVLQTAPSSAPGSSVLSPISQPADVLIKKSVAGSMGPPPPYTLIANYIVSCGRIYTDDMGVIQSPGFPEPYRPDQDCWWEITVPEGYEVAIKFDFFQLESHDDCIYDRLEVYSGDDLMHTFCGSTEEQHPPAGKGQVAPADVNSNSNRMRLRFFSDQSVEKQGFQLTFMKEFDECKTANHGCEQLCINIVGGYRCDCEIGYELAVDGKSCEDACGGYMRDENGTLTSPNFPQPYPAKKKCVWEIEAKPSYKITLNFTHFEVEGMKNDCNYDSIEVLSLDASGNAVKSHGNHCGKMADRFSITSETNRLRVLFSSDASIEKSGFAAVFFTDRDECNDNNGGCQHQCHNTIGSYRCECESGFVLTADGHNCKEGGCKRQLNTPSGVIESPNYPAHYADKSSCVWHVVTIPGHRIQLEFHDFNLERHQTCRYDKLMVFDGSSPQAPVLGKFCGQQVPPMIESTGNELYALFETDASVSRNGFRAEYNSVCGGELTAQQSVGYIFSHAKYSGSEYPNKEDCSWTIRAPVNMAVRLRFTNFHVEVATACEYDYIEVFDGEESTQENNFGRYCGITTPPEFTTASRVLQLHFHTDDSVVNKGFVAEYFVVEPGTGPTTPRTPSSTRRHPLEPIINQGKDRGNDRRHH